MKHYLISLFLSLFCTGIAFAQTEAESEETQTESEATQSPDFSSDETASEEVMHTLVDPSQLNSTKNYASENISVKRFDNKKVREVIGSANYNESEPAKQKKPASKDDKAHGDKRDLNEQESENGSRYLEESDDEQFEQAGSDNSVDLSAAAPVMKLIFYAVVAALIGLIIYHIAKNTSLQTRLKKIQVDKPDPASDVEDIATLDVDTLLRRTLAEGNYRLAMRLYFLGLLKKLNEVGLIDWKKDKTNRDYLSELFAKEAYYNEVRRLTLAYEQVWYGDHDLPVESYQQLMAEFKAIDHKINTSTAS